MLSCTCEAHPTLMFTAIYIYMAIVLVDKSLLNIYSHCILKIRASCNRSCLRRYQVKAIIKRNCWKFYSRVEAHQRCAELSTQVRAFCMPVYLLRWKNGQSILLLIPGRMIFSVIPVTVNTAFYFLHKSLLLLSIVSTLHWVGSYYYMPSWSTS